MKKGQTNSGSFKKGNIPWNKEGGFYSAETRKRMSDAKKGKKLTKETKEKLRLAHKGEINYLWKGENAGYYALHAWVSRWLGKANHCSNDPTHKAKDNRFHWANISGEYKRDLTDWKQLCPSCHKKDGIPIAKRYEK